MNSILGSNAPEENADLPERIAQTVRLAKELEQKTGRWPALLVLTSHPETEGPLQWLRFELLRQGLQIADAVVEARTPGAWYRRHPRCLLAIDPFALDTVSTPVGAFYSAWMHRIYLAWDRQPSTQSWMGWRLIKALKADTPVLMVLSGGLPANARLLYAAREFVHHLPLKRWALPKRQAQKELMGILMKPEGSVWPADQGEIPAEKFGAIREAFVRWGLSPSQLEPALQELQEEFRLRVPYRTRLFRVLLSRIASKGKPLILVGVSHSETAPHVHLSEPVAVLPDADPAALGKSFARFFVSF
jgi:hypothetical protein